LRAGERLRITTQAGLDNLPTCRDFCATPYCCEGCLRDGCGSCGSSLYQCSSYCSCSPTGPPDLSPAAWTGLSKSIKNIPSSGSATFALDVDFDCSDYDSEIPIPTGTNVTVHGNGAVLDAAQNGRFFSVYSGGTLALNHLTLQRGSVSHDVSASFIDLRRCSFERTKPTAIH
jgi:hypothetical protein